MRRGSTSVVHFKFFFPGVLSCDSLGMGFALCVSQIWNLGVARPSLSS